MSNPAVSILVRSHNDREFIGRTLDMLLRQRCTLSFEVISCDDNSSDGTAEIIASFRQVRRVERPRGKYFPGRTLNHMVRHSRGEIIVFNNADAVPLEECFLEKLIAPLTAGRADMVYANQLPRPDAETLVRKDNERAFGDGRIAAEWNFFFSLASAAVRGELVRRYPFDETISYSEDVEWAYRLKKRIVYVPEAVVEHSHNYTIDELKRRFYGEGMADARIFGQVPSWYQTLGSAAAETFRDWLYLLKNHGRAGDFLQAPKRRFIQRYFYRRGAKDFKPEFKVAHVVRRFTFGEWGGTETVVWQSVRMLKKYGITSEILCTSALSEAGTEMAEGVPIRRFSYFYPCFPMTAQSREALDKKGGNPFSPGLLRQLKQGKYDIIHIHCGGRLSGQSVRVARKLHIPCVVSLHGGAVNVPEEEIRKMLLPVRHKFNYGGIYDRIYRIDPVAECDSVLVLNKTEQKKLSGLYPEQKIIYMPNGVNIPEKGDLPEVRKEWGIPAERKLILCISRIDYQKDQKILLSLLKRLIDEGENVHLLLIGPVTSQWYCDEIKAMATAEKLNDHFILIPGLPPGDSRLEAARRTADCFILPSLHEPFGIAAQEAWASGTPLITSDSGGLKDFVVDGRNGLLFPAGDLEALYQAYRKLDRKLAIQALADVRLYSWAHLTGKLAELYRRLKNG